MKESIFSIPILLKSSEYNFFQVFHIIFLISLPKETPHVDVFQSTNSIDYSNIDLIRIYLGHLIGIPLEMVSFLFPSKSEDYKYPFRIEYIHHQPRVLSSVM